MKQNSSGNSAWKLNPNNVSFLAKDIRNSWKLALDSLTLHLLFIHLRSSQSIRTATISQVFTSFHDLTRFLNYTRQDWRSSKIGGLLSQDLHQRLITNSVMTAHPRPPSHPRIRVTVHPLSHIFWPANCAAKSRRRGTQWRWRRGARRRRWCRRSRKTLTCSRRDAAMHCPTA